MHWQFLTWLFSGATDREKEIAGDIALATVPESTDAAFVERRTNPGRPATTERRQFANSHVGLSPDARELAEAIDSFKVHNRRRYITFEETLQVIQSLGYAKHSS
jgi:hypothetical protein